MHHEISASHGFSNPKNSDDSMVVMQPGCSPLPWKTLKWTHLALGFQRASSMSRGTVASTGGMSIAMLLLMAEIRLTSWGWWFIPLFIGFQHHPRWLAGFQPSTVVYQRVRVFCIHSTWLGGMKGFVLWRFCFFLLSMANHHFLT